MKIIFLLFLFFHGASSGSDVIKIDNIINYLPHELEDYNIADDLDSYRILFLSKFKPNLTKIMPYDIEQNLRIPNYNNIKNAIFSSSVVTAIGVPAVISTLYEIFLKCTADYTKENIESLLNNGTIAHVDYACYVKNASVVILLNAFGVIIGEIAGLSFFEYYNALEQEALRNSDISHNKLKKYIAISLKN